MKPGARAARDEVAMQQLTHLASKLADRLGIAPPVLIYERDKAVEAMKHREELAAFLERVVVALPAKTAARKA